MTEQGKDASGLCSKMKGAITQIHADVCKCRDNIIKIDDEMKHKLKEMPTIACTINEQHEHMTHQLKTIIQLRETTEQSSELNYSFHKSSVSGCSGHSIKMDCNAPGAVEVGVVCYLGSDEQEDVNFNRLK